MRIIDKRINGTAFGELSVGDTFLTPTTDDHIYLKTEWIIDDGGYYVNATNLTKHFLVTFDPYDPVEKIETELHIVRKEE